MRHRITMGCLWMIWSAPTRWPWEGLFSDPEPPVSPGELEEMRREMQGAEERALAALERHGPDHPVYTASRTEAARARRRYERRTA